MLIQTNFGIAVASESQNPLAFCNKKDILDSCCRKSNETPVDPFCFAGRGC